MWLLWLALFSEKPPRTRWWAWLGFALCLGGSLWAYETARATAGAVVVFGLFFAATDRRRLRQRGVWFAAALGLGLALAAPHLLDPAAWQRSATLATTLNEFKAGNIQPLLNTSLQALGTVTIEGDPFITYNVPGRPVLDWAPGLLFYGGVVLCLLRWRRPAYAFTLMWLGVGILPSMIVGAWNCTLHSMGMQSVVFVPPALCAVEIGRWAGRRWGRGLERAASVTLAALILLSGLFTFRDYFLRWGEWPEVRAAYFQNLAAITGYLNDTDHEGAVALSSPFPDIPLDPFIGDLRIQRDDLALRWFDARRAIVFPAAESSLLILPPNTPLEPRFAGRLQLQLIERVDLRADDVDPYFDVYEWDSIADAQRFVSSQEDTVEAGGEALPLPVSFGAVELVAYELLESAACPGETVTLVTLWCVIDPELLGPVPPEDYGHELALFVHALDAANNVVGQEDRLDVPAWNWQAGDHLAQLHVFELDPAAEPGTYRLEMGLYNRRDLARLPVIVDGAAVDTQVRLQPLEGTCGD